MKGYGVDHKIDGKAGEPGSEKERPGSESLLSKSCCGNSAGCWQLDTSNINYKTSLHLVVIRSRFKVLT